MIAQLLDEGKAYYCYSSVEELEAMRAEQMARKEKPRYNGYWRDRDEAPPAGVEPVVRFKNPLDGEVVIDDTGIVEKSPKIRISMQSTQARWLSQGSCWIVTPWVSDRLFIDFAGWDPHTAGASDG